MSRVYGDLRPHPDDAVDGIEYDGSLRMKYHPEFHFSHGQPFTQEEMEYLCTFYGVDDARTLSFALGKTEHVCRVKFAKLKAAGLVGHYRLAYRRKLEA